MGTPPVTDARGAFDFRGRRVAIAGGSRGIGRAMAIAFAVSGADVAICARGAAGLAEAHAAIAACGVRAHAHACDLAVADEIDGWIAAVAAAFGGIDVLVNNGSGFGFADDEAGWSASLGVDLMAAVRASRAALPHLRASAQASILHVASIAALRPHLLGAPYAAAKAALMQYTQTQALALAAHGIRVNAIAPGSIEFPGGLWEQRRRHEPARYREAVEQVPFGRLGTAEEVAHAALFLASPWARWITGQTLAVDGGQLLRRGHG